MNLIDLIDFFIRGNSFDDFCELQSLDKDSEVIEIYMQKPFNIESELFFFEIEKTQGAVEYKLDNNIYYNLFDFYYFQETVQDFLEKYSTNEINVKRIAEIILSYSVNDA